MCTPQCICEKLGGLAFDEVIRAGKYVRHYTENLQKLKDKLKDLDDCTEIITREVSVADGGGDEIEVNVLHWQTDANKFKADVEKLMGESTTKASISCIACSCPNIVWRYKFSKQAEEKMADADALIGKFNNFNHQISLPRSHYMENHQKLKVKLGDLGNCREIIRRKVSEANGRGDEIEVNVSQWQTDADSLLANIDQLIRESTYICSTECPCPDITWQYKFSKQAEEKIADADELIIKYNNFNQISHPRPRPPELESLSDKNYVKFDSRASIFKDIMDALQDSNVNMVGVFGLGGVGKTTLVKEVGEQMRKDGTFKQVAMAVISRDLNVKEVQSRLADSLNFEFEAKADYQERRATELWNKLANGDKYLIILDDIWEQVKMEAIGIPCTNKKKGCKVVFTSRNEDLLSTIMEVDRNFSMAILSSAEAWTLFMKKVGNSVESQPKIKSLAYEVCERCKGLPVAINALGEALKGKQEHAWKTALDKLDKYMLTKIEGIHPSVLASLRVSYDMLHSADAKSCFLQCCLFAEDAEIPIDELMRLCVARNLLDQNPHTLDKARNAVRTVVDTLKSASLLTTGSHETVVKIHDVIRDVGISIAREEEAFLVEHGALRWPRNPTDEPLYKAMSLSFKNIKGLPDGLVYPRIHTLMVENTNPRIHTLMVENTKLSDLEVGDNFFNGMTQLAVLTFTRMHMQRLPSSLAKLTNLKMLYLNKCELTDIAVLKDLKSNLEVLSLRGSIIKVLPPEIGQLTSLRALDLQDCYGLLVIPRGVISNLTDLEELYFPMTFDKWGVTTDEQPDTNSRDNASLEELRELLAHAQLTTLHIHVPNVKLLPKEDLKFADLKGFRISVGSKFRYHEELISRTCMLKLEGIQLRNEFIPLVDKAEVLILKPESSVHPLRLFNKLTMLIIKHFKLKYLFSPTTARGLVQLEVLEVSSCEIMEGIVGFEEQKDENEITGEVKFSKLKQLELTSLPNLISFFAKKEEMRTTMGSFSTRAQPLFNEQVIFPVLERLTIDGLGNIIKIWDEQLVAVWQEQGSFCQLTSVNVNKCEKLMHVFPSNMHPLLKNLEELEVEECETMKGIAEFEGERDEDGVRNEIGSPAREHLGMVGVTEIHDEQPLPEPKKEVESLCRPVNNDDIIVFPRLERVTLRRLPKLKSFYSETQGFFSHKVIFPVLERLTIDGLGNIIKIWDKQLVDVWQEQGSFCQLTYLNIEKCEKLMHVFPSNMHPLLKNLEALEVEECETMKGIVEFEGERDEDGVRNEVASPTREHLEMVGVIEIQDKQSLPEPREKVESLCRPVNNDDIIVFPRLERVTLGRLPKLKSFYTEMQGFFSHKVIFPVLERLTIDGLGNIIKIWDKQLVAVWQEQGSFCQLTYLNIKKCEKLMHVFPSNMHPLLKNLEALKVRECETIKGIAEFEGERDEDGVRNEVASPAREHLEMVGATKIQDKQSLPEPKKEVESSCKPVNNDDIIVFPRLKRVILRSLPQLKSFYHETQGFFSHKVAFPVLERLSFWSLDKITRIWDNQPLSELEKKAKSFCQLMEIDVYDCNQLEYVLPSYMLPQLKNILQELSITNCRKMEVIISDNPQEKEATNSNDTIRFPQLKKVKLCGLPNLKSFICSDETQLFFSNKVSFPVLETLIFKDLEKMTWIWDNQPLSEQEKKAKSFSELKIIYVGGCEHLEYVLPFYMLPQLKNLQELKILNCMRVEVIISNNSKEKEATNNNDTIRFPQLKTLELKDLPNFKSFICSHEKQLFFSNKDAFPVLEDIDVDEDSEILRDGTYKKEVSTEECSISGKENDHNGEELDEDLETPTKEVSMEVMTEGNSNIHALPLFNGKVAFPVLETLKFKDLHKITRIWDNQPLSEPEKEAKSFCKLMVIQVEDCDQLEYVLPSYALPQLNNLQNLTISGCTKMEVIISNNPKEKEAANNTDAILFPQLKEVRLWGLPNLKSFICIDETQLLFSNKVIFPVLKKLSIQKVHKIIEIWDKQSIAILEEQGSFCRLKDLRVSECEKLMHVFPSKMHSPLKNLKVLRVSDCPTMEGIIQFEGEIEEDGLRNYELCFSKLSSLELSGLANLESFCTKLEKAGTDEGNSIIHALPLFNRKVIFPMLKKLSIRKVHKIIEIWDKQSIAVSEEQGSFSQLTDLDVSECEKLMHVFPSKMHSPLKNLEVLRMSDCPTMEGIVQFEGEIDEDGLRNELCFTKLSSLELSGLANLESFCTKLEKAGTAEDNSIIRALPLFNRKVTFPVLETLKFKDLHKITRIWDNQLLSEREQEAKSFCNLKEINVEDCDQLEYVLPLYMLPLLKNLEELDVKRCRKMEVIISNNPKEKEATDNNHTIRFPQLNLLNLEGLPNLKSFIFSETQLFFSNKDAFPVLDIIWLDEDSEILRDGTYTKEECSTSGKKSDHNGEELDEDLETPTKEECSTSGKESDHNGEELDEDLETPTKEECGTSGKQNDHNGEQG